MINGNEFRPGNYLLQKTGVRILPVRCNSQHFALWESGEKNIFPILLTADHLKKAGFTENDKYALLPDAHEYIRLLPVQGNGQLELRAYIKNNKECFVRGVLNGVPVSNNVFHLHQLQNLYYAMVGEELEIQL